MGRVKEKHPIPVRVDAAKKRQQALQLRLGGATYDQIAQNVGFTNRGSAYRAVAEALRDIPREEAAELRQLELERFDAIQVRLMHKLGQGDLSVVPNLLRLSEQRAKLLGLNRPEQLEISQDVQIHDDPATVLMHAALVEAVKRRDLMLKQIRTEEDIPDA